MRFLALLLLFLAGPVAGTAAAADDPALQQRLVKLFEAHNAAMRAGKIAEAVAMKTADLRGQIEAELKRAKGEEREMTLAMLRHTAPDSFEVQHFEAPSADEAALYIVGTKVAPPEAGADAGKTFRAEMEIGFAREKGTWKVGSILLLADPDKVKRPADFAFEPVENYDEESDVEFGGRIVRVAEADDHTLVVLRILDEENAVYLPSRRLLEEAGFDVDLLKPYVVVEASGYKHRRNPLKLWATGLSIVR